jgi:hypothetical protein
MMIELPELAPLDGGGDNVAVRLAPAAMLGSVGELDADGFPFWKADPRSLGAGLEAYVRQLRDLAGRTPKIEGKQFLDRLQAFGIDTSEVRLAPSGAIRQEPADFGEANE